MTRIEKIELEIQRLTPTELAAFRDWFHKYDADAWDRQIERDIAAGKLDKPADEARQGLADALAEGAASGSSTRTIPDIIRDTKAYLADGR